MGIWKKKIEENGAEATEEEVVCCENNLTNGDQTDEGRKKWYDRRVSGRRIIL